jgi:predicted metal-dependent hydrolase
MKAQHYRIHDVNGKTIEVKVKRDKRLKRSSRWERNPDNTILLRIPSNTRKQDITHLLDLVTAQLEKQKVIAARRTDAKLQLRAVRINRKYFKGKISWQAIRWVNNMTTRLGSCTNGGSTDGHIRISDRIKNWPDWVIDYIIAHELVHRKHRNHSKEFWKFLTEAFPLAERARGFINGISFSEGRKFEDG